MNIPGEILKAPPFSEPYYTIFYDLDHYGLASAHERWPRHLTIIPPFYLPKFTSEGTMLQTVKSIARHTEEITLEYGEPANYGIREDENIPVFEMIDPCERLKTLHEGLMRYLGNTTVGIGCHFPDVKYVQEKYKPHVSHLTAITSPEDEELVIDSVSIGKKDPAMRGEGSRADKVIVANYELSQRIRNITLRS